MNRLLSVLEDENSPYRSIVSQMVLNYCEGLTISGMSERIISYLLAELRGGKWLPWQPFLISEIADQGFVEERLIPLISDEDSTFQRNLRTVLEQVGQRHGRRYLS